MTTGTLIRTARAAAHMTQSDLAHRAGTSQPAVARYEAGVSSPSVRTLERLLHAAGFRLDLKTEAIAAPANLSSERMRRLRALRPAIENVVREAGGSNVRVFGSVARGEDRPNSDIDLLIDLPIGDSGLGPLIDLTRELSTLLDEEVDVATPELLKPRIASDVLAEAVPF